MHFRIQFQVILTCICLMYLLTGEALPCDSCGNECASACGTKYFRTCCFNYLRKRSDPAAQKLMNDDDKRLVGFILLQGNAWFTQNEFSPDEKPSGTLRKNGPLHAYLCRYR